MSGSRKRPLHVASTLGLACIAATCFLVACGDSDDSSGNPTAGAGGTGAKAGSGSAGKAGGAGKGGSGNQAGEENVAGESGEGGEGGEAGSETGGTGGSTAGTGGTAGSIVGTGGGGGKAGSGGTGGTAGSGGAPPVLVPNCVRDTTSGKTIAISTTGNDGLFGLTHAADGSLYATGYVQDGLATTEDRATVVVKINADGTLNTSWATQGIARHNVRVMPTGLPGQGEMPRGIAFQGTKIIVAGTVEAYTTAQTPAILNNDRDVYVLRLNADGSLDGTFGDAATPGIRVVSLGVGVETVNSSGQPTLSAGDAQYGLNVLTDGSIIVTSAVRSPGPELVAGTPRSDSDFAVLKLTPNGAKDTTFGLNASGVFTLDVGSVNNSVRTTSVLPDGNLIVTGYATFNGTQRPVIFKLLANGSALDQSFGTVGVFSDPVGAAGEAYGALLQSDNKLVTVGYGRAISTNPTDFLSIRLTSNGLLDSTYGATATPGRAWFDIGGLGDNGRAMVLSDNRPVLLGSGSLSSGQVDAVVVVLSADGKPLTTFGSPYGCTAYDFGSVGDSFSYGDVGLDGKIAVVGVTGHGNASTTTDTDATFVLIPKP